MNGGSPDRGRAASSATGAGDGVGPGRGPGPEAEAGAAGAGGPAPEAMMGKEEEIARIARRLDKMVTKKSAVRGAGRQDPGTPAPPTPAEPAEPPSGSGRPPEGQDETPPPQRLPGRGETPVGGRDPCPGPALPFTPAPTAEAAVGPGPGPGSRALWTQTPATRPRARRPEIRLPPGPLSPDCPRPQPCRSRPAEAFLGAALQALPSPQPVQTFRPGCPAPPSVPPSVSAWASSKLILPPPPGLSAEPRPRL